MMNNLDVLATAVQVMKTSNYTCGYTTFHDIEMDHTKERIMFKILPLFLEPPIHICSLFNLTLHIGDFDGEYRNMMIS